MPSPSGPQYFSNLSNAVIKNPRIIHVGGNAQISNLERRGLTLLLDNICKGAFHDAAERGDAPKCHPHTRIAIQTEIMEWIEALEARQKFILWMYGPAGSGKTAIGQSIAEECKKQGLLAASFFFSRTAPGRNHATNLVATIAYQISRCLPQVEDYLFTAIERDPAIFSRTLATQMQHLVIEPLKVLPPLLQPIFVILDGVDEIDTDTQSQVDVLNAMGTAISELRHIPLIFLIASRPEYEIREAFCSPLLGSITESLVLDDSYKPDEDIRYYFDSTFQEICDKHLRLGTNLPSPWPSISAVNQLVSKASGQFIFAATVTKFIACIRHHPSERLDIILGLLTPGNEKPFALLDALYRHILSSVADLPKVLEILTLLILIVPDHFTPTYAKVEELLGFEVRRALVDMHALIFVPPPTDDQSLLRIHHASLRDFLMDRSRSHNLYIKSIEGHLALTRFWSRLMANSLSGQLTLRHCINGFVYHCMELPAIKELAEDLARFNIKQRLDEELEYSDLYDLYSTCWEDFFRCAKKQVGDRVHVFSRLQDDLDAFILEQIAKYPPSLQAHIPTIIVLSGAVEFGTADIFNIILWSISRSPTEFDENHRFDSKLLNIHEFPSPTYSHARVFPILFQEQSRVGKYCVSEGSYAALAKEIIRVIFPQHGKHGQQIKFDRFSEGSRKFEERAYFYDSEGRPHIRLDSLDFEWFTEMLSAASIHLDLAQILHEHALQYTTDVEFLKGRQNIAKASLKYIQRCSIPYLKHTHLPDTNSCVVCDECDGAFVVDCVSISCSSTSELLTRVNKVNNLLNDLGTLDHFFTLLSASETFQIAESRTKSKRKQGAQSSCGELRKIICANVQAQCLHGRYRKFINIAHKY